MNGSDEIKMICNVDQVTKNLRYKILNINEDFYILDMDRSFWIFLFPFIYWFIPHKVYKVDEIVFEKIKSPKVKQKVSPVMYWGTGFILIIGNFIKPFTNLLGIKASFKVNLCILLTFMIAVLLIRFMVGKMNQNKLIHEVYLESTETDKIRIKPHSIKYIIRYIFLYLLVWIFPVVASHSFFIFGNIFILICGMGIMFVALMVNIQAIPTGKAKVKFIK